MQRRSIFVELVLTGLSYEFVDELEVHDLAFGQVGGLVQDEPAVVNTSLERRHLEGSLAREGACKRQR